MQRTRKYVTENGYETTRRYYQCENCEGCDVREECHKSQYNRRIQVSPQLNRFKDEARKNLMSEKGLELRSRRPIEPESVFGHIKYNRGFTRFMLRSLEKVKIEWGLLSIAHNMMKLAQINQINYRKFKLHMKKEIELRR